MKLAVSCSLALALFAAGCAKSAAAAAEMPPTRPTEPMAMAAAPAPTTAKPAAAMSEPPAAKSFPLGAPPRIGDKAECPVTGETFVVSAATKTATHNGRIYAFCCPDCADPFKAEPTKYVKD